ncbi:MAG TPA: hypothetical protein VFC19_04750 [Candidatus Limnocylindrales bacterium]|nr:hypothetical protein [Candidatus Limnocylindrales bacterium]
MRRIAVTGHLNLSPQSVPLVRRAIADLLAAFSGDGLTGITCLARGADSVFAEAVLDRGGTLEVILPSADYRARKVEADHAPQFDALIRRAARVHILPLDRAGRDAYAAANQAMLDSCDELFAVWDGRPGDMASTASVVAQARQRGIPVHVIWPEGAVRR